MVKSVGVAMAEEKPSDRPIRRPEAFTHSPANVSQLRDKLARWGVRERGRQAREICLERLFVVAVAVVMGDGIEGS